MNRARLRAGNAALEGWSAEDVLAWAAATYAPHITFGCHPCTTPVAPGEDPRSGRWRGLEKQECGLHGRLADRLLVLKE